MNARIAAWGLALGLAASSAVVAADAAAAAKGTWRINNWIPGAEVNLVFEQRSRGSVSIWGASHPLADLKGLTREQLRSAHAEVAFTLERDAGVFFLTGTSTLGIASGEFRFAGSPDYAGKLAALGYETVGQDELFGIAIRDISLDFAAAVRAAGLRDAKVADLSQLRDHGIDAAWLRALADLGGGLTVASALELRDHGVEPAYVRDLVAAGNPNIKLGDAVGLHDRGVAASFVKGLVEAGRGSLSVDEVVRLHDHGVDPAYIARVTASGYTALTVDEIVTIHDRGID